PSVSLFAPRPELPSCPTRRSSDLLCLYGPKSPPTSGPSSQFSPNHLRSLIIISSDSLVDLSVSVSSILNMNFPPFLRAYNQLNRDRKSTRLNSSHVKISYAVCCSK